ncbi:MAG TPA: phosphonate C-P lyase system protein PhnH [Chroococcidiopsis sp.]
MTVTLHPGFRDRVHDAQRTFRTLLDALAHPGQVGQIGPRLTPPPGLGSGCAAACLTLLDLETRLWLEPGLGAEPGLDTEIAAWLVFHTGCRMVRSPAQADFAVMGGQGECPDLDAFCWGTADYPEASTTVLLQVAGLSGGEPIVLRGPGIKTEQAIAPQVPQGFWEQWVANHRAYPMGIDVFLFADDQVMGLPRTAAAFSSRAAEPQSA